ncbi:unnamed protein product [Spirodela intermedia]|uniref:ACB domain-containing protein n=1 Tax=Spirodela intermedia TaxID=51605 RepID=A0A7I8IF17_SPIIN|nr:unnamed protein product [Spirodela intermedia]CAA6655975.1 unnamed protein product [Spirodela intermedia]
MNPEEAMEKYVALLSDNMPRWTPQKHKKGFQGLRILPGPGLRTGPKYMFPGPRPGGQTGSTRFPTGLAGPSRFGFSGPIDALIAPRYVT